MMIAKERLYLTADQSALVPEGDERGASLYCAPGDEIPDSAVEKFGLDESEGPAPDDEGFGGHVTGDDAVSGESAPGEAKEHAPDENKEDDVGEDKAAPPSKAAKSKG